MSNGYEEPADFTAFLHGISTIAWKDAEKIASRSRNTTLI